MGDRLWNIAGILFVMTAFMPAYMRCQDSIDAAYERCSNNCLDTAHKCLDKITAAMNQKHSDSIRTECGEVLDICVIACQDAASATPANSHPTVPRH
jgi:hypothetical protein